MPENRFFADIPFEKNQSIVLDGDEFHHLKVMRKGKGDSIELVNGRNQLAAATIDTIAKHTMQVTVNQVDTHNPPKRQLILAQALLKPKNLDFVIEKGTELGATAFWLFPAKNSEKDGLSPNQQIRLRHLAISAMKQCGRLDLPEIRLSPPLSKWREFPIKNAYFGDPRSNISYQPPLEDLLLFVGPEKGLTSEEEALLSQFASGVKINHNTLRAETAALCFLALSSK